MSGRGRTPVLLVVGLAFACGFCAGWIGRGRLVVETEPVWMEAAEELPPDGERPLLLPVFSGAEPLEVLRRDRGASLVSDEGSYFRRIEGLIHRQLWPEHPEGELVRTTGLRGLRLTGPLPPVRPRPLVVLTGDSHMDGVCSDDETAAAVLERGLAGLPGGERARVLNAAVGMYTFPHYLGAAWRYLQLAPDVLVVVVYGGNDFGALETVEAELRGLPRPERPPGYEERIRATQSVDVAGRAGSDSVWQALNQVYLFAAEPELADRALESALRYLEAIERLAADRGTRFIVVYLPPAHDVRPEIVLPLIRPVLEILELHADDLRVTDRLADRLLGGLQARGIEFLDVRPGLRARTEPMFWAQDEHLNVEGQRVVGELLVERLATARDSR